MVQSVEVGAAIDKTIFHVFIINIFCDLNVIFGGESEDKIFGQKDIKLKISLTTDDRMEKESIETDLMVLKHDFHVASKDYNKDKNNHESNPSKIKLICVSKKSFTNMYKPVHMLFDSNSTRTPIDAIKKVIDEFLPNMEKDIDEAGKSTENIEQMLVSPTTFINSVRYIDGKYPIYGSRKTFIFQHFIDDKFIMWNLRKKLSDRATYKVSILRSATKGSEEETGQYEGPVQDDGVNSYFVFGIQTKYASNSKIIGVGNENVFITKPQDKLYTKIKIKTEDVFNDDSTTESNNNGMYTNTILKDVKRFYNNNVTTEESDGYLKNKISSSIQNLSEVSFDITGMYVHFKTLFDIGCCIELVTSIENYSKYVGKYIVGLVDMKFKRENTAQYSCVTHIKAFRGYY
jgi:hypothetical protein